jgi:predicted transcriptional regulator
MTVYETGVDEVIADNSLSDAETAIMRVAHRRKPSTLEELRRSLAHSRVGVDQRIINLAILHLLNTNRLTLTADRQLHVSD